MKLRLPREFTTNPAWKLADDTGDADISTVAVIPLDIQYNQRYTPDERELGVVHGT